MIDPAAALPARRPAAVRVHESIGRGPHYGWWIIVAVLMVTFVGVGIGYYGLAVFLRPLREEHGWSNATVSGATGLYFAVSGLVAAALGPTVDRRGPIGIMAIGAVVMGVSVAAVGQIEEIWHLYTVYLVMAVSFGMMLGTGTATIMNRWFVSRRAQAMSIAFTGPSVGGMVFVPLGTAMIERGGLDLAGPALGIVGLICAVPVILGVLVWDPVQMASEVDFGRPLPTDNVALDDDVQRRLWTREAAVRTVAFWALLIGFTLVLCAQTGFLIHQLAFLEERLGSAQAASFALTVTAFGSVVARLVVGSFGDRVDRRWLTVALFVVQAAAVFVVAVVDSTLLTWLMVLIIGFTIGNVYMMQTLLVSDVFGQISFSTVMGMVSLVVGLGTGLGPLLVGGLEDATGSYTAAFLVTAAMTLAAAVAVSRARLPDGPQDDG